MHDREKIGDDRARLDGIDETKNEKFRELIERVKREGEEEEDFQNRD